MSAVLEKFKKIEEELNEVFFERHDIVRGVLVAMLARKHVLMLGAPGTAKSFLAREISKRILNCIYFEYLLTRFTTPEELFGPFSLKGLQEDRHFRITQGKMPECHVAFIDEVYKGSSAIANSLLTIINERIFHNNGNPQKVPLQTVVAASNELPADSEELAAFHDRFLLKYEIKAIRERGSFIQMLKNADSYVVPGTIQASMAGMKGKEEERTTLTAEELEEAQKEVMQTKVTDEVRELIEKIRFQLQKDGILVSDRVFCTSQDLVKAESWLMGHTETPAEALSICQHCYWDDPKNQRDVKMTVLRASSKELLAIEKAYEEAMELIRPKTKLDDETNEIKEGLETRKKLSKIVRVFQDNIKLLEKKKLPVFKYQTMLEAAKHRLQAISADLMGEEMEALTGPKKKKR
jgi:MoxR-like ATPase